MFQGSSKPSRESYKENDQEKNGHKDITKSRDSLEKLYIFFDSAGFTL